MRYLSGVQPTDRVVLTTCLTGLAAFQAALAAGAPWGAAAYGGAHEGVVPAHLRATSAIATVIWGAAAVAVHRELPRSVTGRRVLLRSLTVVFGVGAVVNLASPSLPERMLWAPVGLVAAGTSWRLSRAETGTLRRDRAETAAGAR
ncbi:MAG: hypothetical protein ACRCY8_18980 [Dermatophilaceae bacterium]